MKCIHCKNYNKRKTCSTGTKGKYLIQFDFGILVLNIAQDIVMYLIIMLRKANNVEPCINSLFLIGPYKTKIDSNRKWQYKVNV